MAIRPVLLALFATIWCLAAPSADAQSVAGRIIDPSGLALLAFDQRLDIV